MTATTSPTTTASTPASAPPAPPPRRPPPAGARGHPGQDRPRRQPPVQRAPVVPVVQVEPGLALPRLVRLVGGQAPVPHRRRRIPLRPGARVGLGRRRPGRAPPPLLRVPAGPQLGQPGRAARDRQGRRVLAPDGRQ